MRIWEKPLDRRIWAASPEPGQGSRSLGVEPLRGRTQVWGRSRATGEQTGHEPWDGRLAGCEHWHVLGGGGEGRETTAWPTSPNVEILSGMLKLPKAGKTFRFSKVWGPSTAPVNWSQVALQADLAHGQHVRSRCQFPLLVPPLVPPTGFPTSRLVRFPREGKFWFWVTQPPTQVTSKETFCIWKNILSDGSLLVCWPC